MSAYDLVAETIKREHRVLDHVVELLQHVLQAIAVEHAEPDFSLLAAALYYIDDFSERLHHPKEDEHLFTALRARSSHFNVMLDGLQREHLRSAEMVGEMHAALVHYLADAYGSLQAFKSKVDAYASMLREHMRKEERLLDGACTCLPESEWCDILAAFEANKDPLLAQEIRTEFSKLYRRILNLLPQKLRYPGAKELQ